MEQYENLLTRDQLATRWSCSVRKIDRMKKYGLIPWIDISGGIGTRPTVRFPVTLIEEFETRNLKKILTL